MTAYLHIGLHLEISSPDPGWQQSSVGGVRARSAARLGFVVLHGGSCANLGSSSFQRSFQDSHRVPSLALPTCRCNGCPVPSQSWLVKWATQWTGNCWAQSPARRATWAGGLVPQGE